MDDISTLEMMIVASVDPYYFRKIIDFAWSQDNKQEINKII